MTTGSVLSQDLINEFVGNSHGNVTRVRELLAAHPALVNSVAAWGETPVQAAAQTGQREIVELLVSAGAPVDICTAAMLGDRDRVAAMLAQNGNRARATGAHGLPAMYYPACNGRVDIAELLLTHGAAVSGGEGVSPPLHGAIYFNQPAMAEWLLAHGAPADALDYQCKSALQAAIDRSHSEAAAVIRGHGGKALASGYAEVQGGKLYYQTEGEGPALLLIHAGVADLRMWDDQVPAFAQRYRVIRFDLRGFGKSESRSGEFSYRQDIADLLKHLGIDKVYIVGVSIGGQIVTDFTLEHPEMVMALIPVAAGLSGFDYKPDDSEQARYEAMKFAEMDKLWEQRDFPAVIDLNMQLWVAGPMQPLDRVSASVRERMREMLSGEEHHAHEELKSKRLMPPAAGRLSEIQKPTLVIVGDLDVLDVLAACDILARQIPSARKVVIPGTAHMLNMEKPVEFNRIVLDFLTSI
jgi:pimeloyl-ACP methyl ester carboxylesterase